MNVGATPTERQSRRSLELSKLDYGITVSINAEWLNHRPYPEDNAFVFKHKYPFISIGSIVHRWLSRPTPVKKEFYVSLATRVVPDEKEKKIQNPTAYIVGGYFCGSHVEYAILFTDTQGEQTEVRRRYSQFDKFHARNWSKIDAVLPPKKYFFNMNLDFVKSRAVALNAYMDHLLKNTDTKWLLSKFLSF